MRNQGFVIHINGPINYKRKAAWEYTHTAALVAQRLTVESL